jgi:2-succinyl-5-enolpyruvyl-6-hydroxy-3-cyclohexene-1-carboxylate synthase
VALQQSVPSPHDVQATFAATLLDEWCRSGLRDVVVCPGSRSTPLAVACVERSEVSIHVRIDERSAGFFAIGRSLASGRPVAVVVTSGTAAAELHAAVAEADLSNVALLVLTADRPPELRGVGAAQTILQTNLYGSMVRRFEEPGVARLEAAGTWRPLASRLWADAAGEFNEPGPVHLNVSFIEPLLGSALDLPVGRDSQGAWRTFTPASPQSASLTLKGQRVLAVVGRGVDAELVAQCQALNWVVLGDATAQGSTPYFDTLLRDDLFVESATPDVIIRLGGLPASKVLQERTRAWGVRVVALRGAGPVSDPDGLVSEVVAGLPSAADEELRGEASYADMWRNASSSVGEYLGARESDDDALNEPLVARTVVELSGELAVPLTVGSSMPVRDVEWWAGSRRSPTFANRGANGIDGVVSTAFGVCTSQKGIGLVGDVTLLHDTSALVDGLGDAKGSCVLVVSDNQGGGIFSFLPQALSLPTDRFERLFATPRAHDIEAIARAFGHQATTVETRGELRLAVINGLSMPGVTVVVAKVPTREDNVRLHETLNHDVQIRRVRS